MTPLSLHPDRLFSALPVQRDIARRLFAANCHLFRETPSRPWLDWVFVNVSGFTEQLSAKTADACFDTINHKLANEDTRAFLSIPVRHDVARRVDCGFLAELVSEHRLGEDEAAEIAVQLAYELPKKAYKLDG